MLVISVETASDKKWDYIFVGGGLSASVTAHRLFELDPELDILIIEAGPDANNRSDIVWPNSTNLVGGQFDWNYSTTGQKSLDNRSVAWPAGKAMGGGTTINSGRYRIGSCGRKKMLFLTLPQVAGFAEQSWTLISGGTLSTTPAGLMQACSHS